MFVCTNLALFAHILVAHFVYVFVEELVGTSRWLLSANGSWARKGIGMQFVCAQIMFALLRSSKRFKCGPDPSLIRRAPLKVMDGIWATGC